MSYAGDKAFGGGERSYNTDLGRFADGLTQIDRAPLKGIPAPPKCPRYGDEWANSPAGLATKGPGAPKSF
jgi:hypothetical protein